MIISAHQLSISIENNNEWNGRRLKGIVFPCHLSSIKLLSLEIITLAFRDLKLDYYAKNGKLIKKNVKIKRSSVIFFESDWKELCADLAGIEDLKGLYYKNPNGIKLSNFERTRYSRKPYKKRRVKE